MDAVKWLFENSARLDRIQPLASILRAVLERAAQATLPVAQSGLDSLHLRYDAPRRVSGCRRAHIGDQVRKCRVDFMTDGGNHRDARGMDRADHDLLVECPEVF